MNDKPSGRSFPPVRALERGLQVMQAVSQAKDATATQVANRLDLPRPTVIRLLETLEGMGFIERNCANASWRLTHHCRTLSDGYNDEAWMRDCALPEIERLGREILWPVDLMVFQNYRMVVRESTHRFSPFSIVDGIVGTALPLLESSGGRAWLAFCSETERQEILKHLEEQEKEKFDRAYVNRMIAQTIEHGYAWRCKELYKETSSFSLPVYANGRLQAVLTVVWFASAMSVAEAIRKLRDRAEVSARRISQLFDAHPDLQPTAATR